MNEFVYITDHTYTKKQVLRMEQLILKVLTFDLFVPTTTMFVNLYATMTPQGDNRVQYLTGVSCNRRWLNELIVTNHKSSSTFANCRCSKPIPTCSLCHR